MKRKTVLALTIGFIGGLVAGGFAGYKLAEDEYGRLDDYDDYDDEDYYDDFDEDDFDDEEGDK